MAPVDCERLDTHEGSRLRRWRGRPRRLPSHHPPNRRPSSCAASNRPLMSDSTPAWTCTPGPCSSLVLDRAARPASAATCPPPGTLPPSRPALPRRPRRRLPVHALLVLAGRPLPRPRPPLRPGTRPRQESRPRQQDQVRPPRRRGHRPTAQGRLSFLKMSSWQRSSPGDRSFLSAPVCPILRPSVIWPMERDIAIGSRTNAPRGPPPRSGDALRVFAWPADGVFGNHSPLLSNDGAAALTTRAGIPRTASRTSAPRSTICRSTPSTRCDPRKAFSSDSALNTSRSGIVKNWKDHGAW